MRRWQAILSYVMISASLVGCALFSEDAKRPKVNEPPEKVFVGSYDDVWRAVMLALQTPRTYPLRSSLMESGVVETEPLRGSMGWVPPFAKDPPSSGQSYRLLIRIIKGDLRGQEAYKVTVLKSMQIERDFISDPEPLETDGFEELTILYRVGRELAIDRALKKAHARTNQRPR
jgi:hypothetical protein